MYQGKFRGYCIGLGLSLFSGFALNSAQGQLLRGPYLQSPTDTEMTFCWRTSTCHTGAVFLGTSVASTTNLFIEPSAGSNHTIRVSGLEADTTYFYRIMEGTNQLAGGTNLFFQTAPVTGSQEYQRVWVLGDSGTANHNSIDVYNAYRQYSGTNYTDLMLMLGDNAYQTGTDLEYQLAVFDIYPEILGQTAWLSCYGNHDSYSADSATQTGPYFDIFSFPTTGECGGAPSGTETYFSFDYGNVHYVSLDTSESSVETNGAMYGWLVQDLAVNTSDWLVVICHHPPYTKGGHDSDHEIVLYELRQNFLPLLEAAGLDLLLSGHSHSYERSFLLKGHYGFSPSFRREIHAVDGGDGKVLNGRFYEKRLDGEHAGNGAVYVVAGSGGKVTYPDEDYPHPAMYASILNLGSVLIEVEGKRMDVLFMDQKARIKDQFSILKVTDTDADNDGLPDIWEEFHFGNTTNAVASQDTDQDLVDNLTEFRLGTSPHLKSGLLDLHIKKMTNAQLSVTWESAPFRNYNLWKCSDLSSNDWSIISSNILATAPLNCYEINTCDSNAFYRAELK